MHAKWPQIFFSGFLMSLRLQINFTLIPAFSFHTHNLQFIDSNHAFLYFLTYFPLLKSPDLFPLGSLTAFFLTQFWQIFVLFLKVWFKVILWASKLVHIHMRSIQVIRKKYTQKIVLPGQAHPLPVRTLNTDIFVTWVTPPVSTQEISIILSYRAFRSPNFTYSSIISIKCGIIVSGPHSTFKM